MNMIDPWGSSIIDYDKLTQQFGIKAFGDVVGEIEDPSKLMKRGIIFGQRDYKKITDALKKEIFIVLAISSAKLSAAKALAKKPAKVIHICIVDKNTLELLNNFWILSAFLFFFLHLARKSYLSIDKKANSAAENKPFITIKIANTIIFIIYPPI